jgi:hypothetical protein
MLETDERAGQAWSIAVALLTEPVAQTGADQEQSLPHPSAAPQADQAANGDADDTGSDNDAGVSRGHPNRPVMYASVRDSDGLVKIFDVGPISTS